MGLPFSLFEECRGTSVPFSFITFRKPLDISTRHLSQNLQAFLPNPLFNLDCIHITLCRHLLNTHPWILQNILLYLLKFLLLLFPAGRADNRSYHIVENVTAFPAISNIHSITRPFHRLRSQHIRPLPHRSSKSLRLRPPWIRMYIYHQ